MANTNPRHVVTGKARFSYEHVMQPYRNPNSRSDSDPRYSLTVLVPKSDTATKARIDAAIKAALKWGEDRKVFRDGTPLDRLPIPVYDGDGYRADGFTEFGKECKGMWVFTASTPMNKPPQVVDAARNPIINTTDVYSGCWGRVGVDFFPYNQGSKQGIGCSLCNVQKLADDTPLGSSRPTADEDFSEPTAMEVFDPLS